LTPGKVRPKQRLPRWETIEEVEQEWTQAAHVDGVAIFEQPQESRPVQTGPYGPERVFERQPVSSRKLRSCSEASKWTG
jgi:hypothetical protein